MGISATTEKFIDELSLKPGFSVCELGDQWLVDCSPHRLARDMYLEKGCGRYVSLDGNGRGTHKVDLNLPLPKSIVYDIGTDFDLVTDYGTGEHIFDQAQVWRTLHALVRVGGFIAFDRPTQGWPDHGFYNVQPTLFQDLARANGYQIVKMVEGERSRGQLISGIFQRTSSAYFQSPQQGKYRKALRPLIGRNA